MVEGKYQWLENNLKQIKSQIEDGKHFNSELSLDISIIKKLVALNIEATLMGRKSKEIAHQREEAILREMNILMENE